MKRKPLYQKNYYSWEPHRCDSECFDCTSQPPKGSSTLQQRQRKWDGGNRASLGEPGMLYKAKGGRPKKLELSLFKRKNQCHPYHPPSRCAKALASLEAAEAGSRVATDGVEAFMRSAKTKGS
eukprot:scaffold45697_cov18-Tisochrysis_lutea.AAC.1